MILTGFARRSNSVPFGPIALGPLLNWPALLAISSAEDVYISGTFQESDPMPIRRILSLLICALFLANAVAQTPKSSTKAPVSRAKASSHQEEKADLSKQPTLYVVGYAHLDTEWRWEYPQTIQEYLSKTLRNNFALFDKYPHYIFNFTGANRYRLMKEYYPADFERMKKYVAAGRWFPAGSSMEEGDVNSPNAESIIRQVLYGNQFFRREFGVASNEYMLPDCFGFPASLPSILNHAGIRGFSTQKLSSGWQPAPHVGGPTSPEQTPEGIPFNVGVWEGLDGSSVLAALNPLSYGSQVTYDISKSPDVPTAQQGQQRNRQEDWVKRIQINGDLTGIRADFHYVGTGDIGGAPDESSVKMMESIITRTNGLGGGPIHVEWAKADQIFNDIAACCKTDRMPRYKGDLELINHSAGSLTSEAYQKRWMRKNELLAAAAEGSSVAAAWLGALPYQQQRLNNAWTLVMGGQFHDLLPGTATPKAFEFAWNDDVIAMNQFAGVLSSATSAVAAQMDTRAQGTSIVVYNPLSLDREDVVEADVALPENAATAQVVGPGGQETLGQIVDGPNGRKKVLLLAKAPSIGYSVYDVRPTNSVPETSTLRVSESSLENERFRVTIDQNGDVSSIIDKKNNQEVLSAPIRLAISTDNPRQWPAWNMDFEDEQRAPRSYVSGPAKVRIVENGPVRVAVEVDRETEGSHFIQTIRLASGDAGNRIEFANSIDWKTQGVNLKAVFPLKATNKMATYNWDVGTIQRLTEDERQFEVASHQWIDLSDAESGTGATILTDTKNGSDKPDDHTIRLTLIRTPGTRGGYEDQGTQDLGHHEIVFGLAPHAAGWQAEETDWQAQRLNQPLIAFQSPKHPGELGKEFSLLKVNNDRVRVLALKKAENSDETIVRLVELDGREQSNVTLHFAAPVASAREVNGQEQPVGAATIDKGQVVTSLKPFQLRSFAIKLAAPPVKLLPGAHSAAVQLIYDTIVSTHEGHPTEGCFDCSFDRPGSAQGKALPAEMLPRYIDFAGAKFVLADAQSGKPNAVIPKGQSIALPPADFNHLYVLAAGANADQKAVFRLDDKPIELTVQEWTGFIGQWDDRIWRPAEQIVQARPGAPATASNSRPRVRVNEYAEMVGIRPGYIKRADIAWFSSHRHNAAAENEPYNYSYLYAYTLELPAGTKQLTLPNNDRVRILAISAVKDAPALRPVQPLYDTLEVSSPGAATISGDTKIMMDRNGADSATSAFKFKNVPSPSKDDAASHATLTMVVGQQDVNGGNLAALTDGSLPDNEDDPEHNFFFSAGGSGGRFRIDLGAVTDIAQVNSYSWHPNTRGPQVYNLYAADGNEPGFNPAPDGRTDPAKAGWKLIAMVDTRTKWGSMGGQYGVNISSTNGPSLGRFRYLLFDVVPTETDDPFGHTFFSEIDVVAAK